MGKYRDELMARGTCSTCRFRISWRKRARNPAWHRCVCLPEWYVIENWKTHFCGQYQKKAGAKRNDVGEREDHLSAPASGTVTMNPGKNGQW